jgi:NADH dehydrogenase
MNLVSFRNRLLVLVQWGWNYFTFDRSARLITGESSPAVADSANRAPSEIGGRPPLPPADR